MKHTKTIWRFRNIAAILAAMILFLLVSGALANIAQFSKRVQTPEAWCYDEAQFSGLCTKPVSCSNREGESLAGWLYSADDTAPKGLIVLAHGMGYGHRAYLNVAAYFAGRGYLVFAYDMTGCDASGGASPRGVPQALLDLDAALDAAEALPEAADLPVFLFGHSLGAYACCAVLEEHPEVRAVAALAGFDSTAALLRARFGIAGTLLTPGAVLWERLRFGAAADRTSLRGFASSTAQVLIVHSSDDPEVQVSCGLDRYAEVYGSDPRFRFLRLDGKGHGGVFTGEVAGACLALYDSCCK